MKEPNVNKNISLDYDNFETIRQMMHKSRLNFSRTLNLIIHQWLRLTKEIDDAQKQIDKLTAEVTVRK